MQAYELMMQAKAYRDLLSAEGNVKVSKCFQEALALNPHFARAPEASIALAAFSSERHLDYRTRKIAIEEDTVESLADSFRAMWRDKVSCAKLASGLHKAGLPN